jgi:DNA polymerase delta subunit 1
MRDKSRGEEKNLKNFVLGVEKTEPLQSLMGFQGDKKREFLKIYVAMPSLVPGCKRLIDEGITIAELGFLHGQTYESNVPYVLRFMIDKEISGADWIELPANSYSIRKPKVKSSSTMSTTAGPWQTSRCTLEVDVMFNQMIAHPSTPGFFSSLAPLRILSFDIECQGRKGHFPDAQFDPVIQIASVVSIQGQEHPIIRSVFTLNTCLPIVGARVDPSMNEVDLLLKWRAFVLAADPDIITGYNIGNFDFPYLLNRAKTLEKTNAKIKIFADLGRIRGVKAVMKDTTFQSSAYGKRENIETTIQGRVIFDVLPYMFRNHKLSSYSLNSVSAEFLGQQKEDVHHSIISDLQMGSDADRRRLAVYCLKDAFLPLLLMKKLSIVVNYIEMARVTGVPLNFILTRGQQIKVFSMILRKCKREKLLVPHVSKGNSDESTYEGATVIDPKKAFYEVPIATLDFASLYPSIMQVRDIYLVLLIILIVLFLSFSSSSFSIFFSFHFIALTLQLKSINQSTNTTNHRLTTSVTPLWSLPNKPSPSDRNSVPLPPEDTLSPPRRPEREFSHRSSKNCFRREREPSETWRPPPIPWRRPYRTADNLP